MPYAIQSQGSGREELDIGTELFWAVFSDARYSGLVSMEGPSAHSLIYLLLVVTSHIQDEENFCVSSDNTLCHSSHSDE